ncbi:proprotein convertase subtilisin/kexin type 6 L homeolog precursor [Xenopus laevis]|uniref:Proprotein convertase subtilisin/kexin type 6 L homeolog precursor n=1 Tax=Xenopus laevis TaxID=8355 RepID=Q68KF9_XENLA|nr:proprotein convertase subtilisin/kexin type 6 L homeolog precursor [Xenopus laevis]AAI70175.1 Subtilisin-like kinase SPC4 [Xenopus laevis]AAT99304.1 subtilisin-like kinase SPC4 [Xenopus laevis]
MLPTTGRLLLFLLPACLAANPLTVFSNHWAVRIPGGSEVAAELAVRYGYLNLGQIGNLENYYHFYHSKTIKRSTYASRGTHNFLRMDPKVEWMQQQEVKRRVKRHVRTDPNPVNFNDPIWPNMWYLHCSDESSRCRSEMNVMAAWQRGYTGKNVVVSILDDGVEKNHPDLVQNYDPHASHDVNGNDQDPSPRYDSSNENKHGTRCAGEVAASANNSHCIVGIAYNARIGGIRMLDGDVTDVVEAKSLGVRPDYIDIYSSSWGPDDDGKTVDGPGPLARKAFEDGIKKGRKGLGSIFVWASGNGGREGDYCSCDGYTNSIYTISISSTTENGYKPWYLEECASTLATTYSSGAFYERKIVTTDLRQGCTDDHTGTSVSAPMVAGVIALALEANPMLNWRDVQHLLVKTSRSVHLRAPDWRTNGAGRKVSHLYGFGLVDADAMVVEAKRWRTVPPQHVCIGASDRRPRFIRADQLIRTTTQTNACVDNAGHYVTNLEHVVVRVTISHPRRGDLQIYLISPSGTKSQLLAKRTFDSSNEGFKNWEFMTVHCWGEKAEGEWTLEIHDSSSQLRNPEIQGKLKEWTLILYGTSEHPYNPISAQHSRTRTLDISATDLEPSKSTVIQSHLEIIEEEEEYSGPCHPECGDRGCDGPTAEQCLNCVHYSLGSVKAGRRCVSSCPSGFMADVAGRRCRRCFRGCEACYGRGHNQCSSCKRGFYLQLDSSSCAFSCPLGTYADENLKKCIRCQQNCKKCVGSSEKCTFCKDGFSLTGSLCVPECEQGTFYNTVPMKCEKCHPSCHTCMGSGKEQCTQCARDFHLHEWRCVPACSPGFYSEDVPGLSHKVCRRCEDNCLSCEASGRNCVRCREGYSLLSGSCVSNNTCNNADEMFCEMVKSSKLCERKLFIQFCCRTCLLAG